MVKETRVLFLCSWYPNKGDAFIGNFIQRHAQSAALFNEVVTLSVHPADEAETSITRTGKLTEVRVYYQRRLPFFSQYRAYKKGYATLKQQGFTFDLVHLNVLYPAALLALQIKLPLFISEHFSGYHKISQFKWTWFKKWLTKRTLRKSALVLPVSHHLGKAIQQFEPAVHIQKVSNVVDTTCFTPRATASADAPFTFLHISTLEERSKNITGLLKGFKALADAGVNFLLQIGGDGDIEHLREQIKSCGLMPQHVAIITPRPSKEIAQLMQAADCFVLFSHFENQPCVILEALCCGTPVISSNVGGIAEELDTHNGILVEPGNHSAFVNALSLMANRGNQYVRKDIAKEAHEKYSMPAIGQQLTTLYTNALRANS